MCRAQSRTPLILAALNSHTALVALLLERDADVDAYDDVRHAARLCVCVRGTR